MNTTGAEQGRRVGGGRSGEVFLVETEHGLVARKVFFGGDRLTRLVHYICFGAPNPYAWNEDAIRAALYRRQILRALANVWFGPRLNVANAFAVSWNDERKAWQLDTEYIEGGPPPLCHPLRDDCGPRQTLVDELMPALQRRLIEAGFDGTVWQAGWGNPVALNNFLMTSADRSPPAYWLIDVESGVPALFPLNPLPLLRFYLPRAVHYRRPLFDDVDIVKLRTYVADHEPDLVERLGPECYRVLQERIDLLDDHQRRWKSLPRTDRAIEYQRSKGRLSEEQAEWYRRHRVAWKIREAWRAIKKFSYAAVVRLPRKLLKLVRGIPVREALARSWQLIKSQDQRAEFARGVVRLRLDEWHERGQLADDDRQTLREELESDEASSYMTDFGAHVGLKAVVQTLELTLFSTLYAMGLIGGIVLVVLIAADGALYRSTYTLYRMAGAARRRQPLPWVALVAGLIPLVGSLAFPAQMAWSSVGRGNRIARFIIYDTVTGIGVKLPIWGGRDTRTEHFFNNLAHRFVAPLDR